MPSHSDSVYMLLRARDPQIIAATGAVYAEDVKCLVTVLQLNAGAAAPATAVFRKGGSGGTIIWNLSATAGSSASTPFPSGLFSDDGIHVTITGAGATVGAVGVNDA